MTYRDDPPALATPRRGAYLPRLDRLTVRTPCTEPWAKMVGDDRVRHCRTCDQQVYNLAAMTTAEVEALIAQVDDGARVCGQLLRRHDGTIITADCVASRARRRKWAARAAAVGAVLAAAGATFAIAATPTERARPWDNLPAQSADGRAVIVSGELATDDALAAVPIDRGVQATITADDGWDDAELSGGLLEAE
jgi:hypothetical protein